MPSARTRRFPTRAFGAQLRKLRGLRTRGEICRRVAHFGLALDPTQLLHYERGSVTSPDPGVLWALGRVYHLRSIDELLTVLVMDRSGRALRSGIDIAAPGLTPAQLHIAELFGALPPPLQKSLANVMMELAASSVRAVQRRRPTTKST